MVDISDMIDQEIEKTTKGKQTGLAGFLGTYITELTKNIGATQVTYAPKIFTSLFTPFWEWLEKAENVSWKGIMDFLEAQGLINPTVRKNIMNFQDIPAPLGTFFNILALTLTMGGYMKSVGEIVNTPALRNLNAEMSPNLPREEHLLKAAFIAPERIKEVRNQLRRSGFSEESIDLMFISSYALYDVNTVRDLYLRKAIDTDMMFVRMREIGFTDTRTKEIVQSWELIPGPSDLFHLVAKEAFEPGMIKEMGLDVEFPEEQVQWLEAQGLSRYWAEKYWAAHWDIPSLGQGFDMLHRRVSHGVSVIDEAQLDMLYRAAEIPPFWREKLTAIAYNPFTRVDVRRMHDIGVLNEEQVYDAYRDLGFDHQKATDMLFFTIKYNQQNDKELTKSQIIAGYNDKFINQEDTIALLVDIGYEADQALYLLLLEDYKEDQRLIKLAVSNIEKRYKNGLIDAFKARGMLNNLNLPSEKIELYMDEWELDKFEDVKIPSKTDLGKFLNNKIIDVDTFRLEMNRLGYNHRYATWYEELALKGKGI